jgi:hypothetical protein
MQSPWRLEGRTATLALGPLRAITRLDAAIPGLAEVTVSGQPVEFGQILGIVVPNSDSSPNRLVDAYVRGNDLVATYVEDTQRTLRWQVYWRACSDQFPMALAAVEAIVSVQTDLLDSHPTLNLLSGLPFCCGSIWREIAPDRIEFEPVKPDTPALTASAKHGWSCFGVALPGSNRTYVELVHPDDFLGSSFFQQADWPAEGMPKKEPDRTMIFHRLFDDRLEKGVIRRSRVLGLFLPERPAGAQIAELKGTFAAEPLPLTT